MFASVSHEFRTPLNAFVNALQIVKMSLDRVKLEIEKAPRVKSRVEGLYPKIDKMLRIGDVSSKLLMNLVEDILDLAKYAANTLKLNLSPFTLDEVLEEIEYIFGFQCREKQLDFEIKVQDGISNLQFCSDAKRIKQVLINLISNSFKFTRYGGIEITARVVHEGQNKRFLEFTVYDTGIGIKKTDLRRLFQMFGMLEDHQAQLNKSGTGIGLSISKNLVESLGGTIVADSEEGKWTEFKFTIEDANFRNNNREEEKVEHNRVEDSLEVSYIYYSYIILLNLI